MDYGLVIGLVVCAVLVDRLAPRDKVPSILWTTLSVTISLVAIKFTPWGIWGLLGCQAVLLIGMTVFHLVGKDTVPLD